MLRLRLISRPVMTLRINSVVGLRSTFSILFGTVLPVDRRKNALVSRRTFILNQKN